MCICISSSAMEEETIFPSDSDQDFSFTSCASNTSSERTLTSTSARSSAASLPGNVTQVGRKPHRGSDPHWSAIAAATSLSPDGKLHLRHLKLLRHLGSGDLGRVYLCQLKDASDDNALFALKVVDKDMLSEKKLSHVQTEAHVLASLDHPFLPTLYAHLEASHYTCLLIDYCAGGDLHALLRRRPGNRLPLPSVRFYAAEVLVALEYLHSIGVVYRDLKPENVLRRADGHIMLSDFDLCFHADVDPMIKRRSKARPTRSDRFCGCFGWTAETEAEEEASMTEVVAEPVMAFSRACVGTHEYLAPEVINGNGHGNGVDWWAFGVFLYELLYGRTPFKGGCKEDTLRNIASMALRFPEGDDVAGMVEVRDLISRLLVRDPRRRLGCAGGATEVKRHPFFGGIKWPLIRCYRPPGSCGSSHKDRVTERSLSWKEYLRRRSSLFEINGHKKIRKWT